MKIFGRPSQRSFGGLAAKEYFHETPVLLILLRKINKTGVSENFILPPKAAEYLRDSLFFLGLYEKNFGVV
jgi:hypothetical protein